MRGALVLLPALLLAGCSRPTDPLRSGGLWLLELPGDALPPVDPWPGLAAVLEEPLKDGRAFPWGEQGLQRLFRELKKKDRRWLRESERFAVERGKEAKVEIADVFSLRFTSTPRGKDEQSVAYTFAWAGGTPVSGTCQTSDRGCFAFAAPRPGGRVALLVVAFDLGEYGPDEDF